MPLYKTIISKKNSKVFIWHITESFDELNCLPLTNKSQKRVQGMKSEIHQKGFLSIRHLLKTAGYKDAELYYSNNGKPHLKDKKHISITHSFNFSAIIISDCEVGIDIEMKRDKIKRIADKFVNSEIYFLTEKYKTKQLTIIWGAKESLYKMYPNEGLSFKKHIFVDNFDINDSKTTAEIKMTEYHRNYDVFYEEIEDYVLVYAYPND